MCGRYFIEESPELRPIIEAMNRSPLVAKFQKSSAVLSQGEIRPTNVATRDCLKQSWEPGCISHEMGIHGEDSFDQCKNRNSSNQTNIS